MPATQYIWVYPCAIMSIKESIYSTNATCDNDQALQNLLIRQTDPQDSSSKSSLIDCTIINSTTNAHQRSFSHLLRQAGGGNESILSSEPQSRHQPPQGGIIKLDYYNSRYVCLRDQTQSNYWTSVRNTLKKLVEFNPLPSQSVNQYLWI